VIYAAQRKKDTADTWINRLIHRRNTNVAVVALANKNARIVWALLAQDREFQADYTCTAASA
jgi:transposase